MTLPRPRELAGSVCALCGSARTARLLTRGDGLNITVCRCGLGRVDPMPSEDEVRAWYDGEYFAGTGGVGYTDYFAASTGPMLEAGSLQARAVEVLRAELPLNGSRVLEIGAGTGALLELLRREGALPTGVEPSAAAAEFGRQRFGVDIVTGYLDDLSGSLAGFDCAVLLEVLEHLRDPVHALREVARRVRPGGKVLLSTPNFGLARWQGRRYAGLGRSYEHLFYWDEASLTRTVAAAGLRPIRTVGFNKLLIQRKDSDTVLQSAARAVIRRGERWMPATWLATTLLAVGQTIE